MGPTTTEILTDALERAAAAHGVYEEEELGGELDVQAVLTRRDSLTSNWSDESQVQRVDIAGISLARSAGVVIGQVTEHLRRRRVAEGRDVDQEERRQCGRVDSRARAA
jgi:ABC-type transporter Mla MlaB component